MDISIIIPLYNKCKTIGNTLESVFNQTVQPTEIIIVNDGSTDGSEQIVQQINYPLVKLIHQSNAGVSAARNRGIEEAKGDWIAFLDADDEWLPHYLETIVFLQKTYPEAGVLATSYFMQDHKGNRKPITLNKIPFQGEHGILTNYFEVASCSHPPLSSSAVVVKKEAIQSVGGFPVGIKSGEDLLTWARLAVKFEIAYHMKSLAVFIILIHDKTDKRLTGPPIQDIVGDNLKKILKEIQNHEKKFLRLYIYRWTEMRTINFLLYTNNKTPPMKEVMKSLKYRFPREKIIFLFFLSFFNHKQRIKIINYFRK